MECCTLLLSDAKQLFINNSEVKEVWLNNNKVWELSTGESFTRLSYIQTSATTGGWEIDFIPTYNTHMKLSFAQHFAENTISSGTTYKGWIYDAGIQFGAHYRFQQSQYSSQKFSSLLWSAGGALYQNGIEKTTTPQVLKMDELYTIEVNKRTLTLGGYTKTDATSAAYVSNATKKLLLGGQGYSTGYSSFGPQRFYECTIYDENDNVIIHLIPVLKDSDGMPYLYDEINNIFYETTNHVFPTQYLLQA